jgi:hypothetical protein
MDKLGLPWDAAFEVIDLLTGVTYPWQSGHNYVALDPTAPAHIFRVVRK